MKTFSATHLNFWEENQLLMTARFYMALWFYHSHQRYDLYHNLAFVRIFVSDNLLGRQSALPVILMIQFVK